MSKSAADDDVASPIRSSVKSDSDQKPSATASLLDQKEGEQAKALFEKVKKFRTQRRICFTSCTC